MSKFSNFKIKWPKSVEKLENGGRLGPLRQDLPPPPNTTKKKLSAGSASTVIYGCTYDLTIPPVGMWTSRCEDFNVACSPPRERSPHRHTQGFPSRCRAALGWLLTGQDCQRHGRRPPPDHVADGVPGTRRRRSRRSTPGYIHKRYAQGQLMAILTSDHCSTNLY